MAIIDSLHVYASFRFTSLSPEMLEKFRYYMRDWDAHLSVKAERGLLLLECFLQVTGQSLDLCQTASGPFTAVAQEFIGALYCEQFYAASLPARYEFARAMQALFQEVAAQPKHKIFYVPLSLKYGEASAAVEEARQKFRAREKNLHKVELWKGWTFFNDRGVRVILPLYGVYVKFGAEFTARLFAACKTFQLVRRRTTTPCLKELATYLERQEALIVSDFLSTDCVTGFLKDFGSYYFKTGSKDGKASVAYLCATWAAFKNLVDECFIPQKVFARYRGEFPLVKRPSLSGDACHVAESDFGLVKEKLITPVPLEVTDAVAMELLEANIQNDHAIILRWARTEVRETWARYEQREKAKKLGRARFVQAIGGCDGTGWLNSKDNPDRYLHAATTFDYHGYLTERDGAALHLLYPLPLRETAQQLAIPGRWNLWAHCAVLIACHPSLTESMLTELQLYDKFDQKVGFQEADTGGVLIAYKRRRGELLAEERINLTAESANVVRQIIELTEPLREYLRARNDANWRLLLLSSGKGFGYPKRCYFEVPSRGTSLRSELIARLSKCSEISQLYAEKLLDAFSINSWRATTAIVVFFSTGSALEMSRSLGHSKYDTKLMTRYLPTPIFSFFQDRHIRQFQIGIIFEAMQDSDLLSKASGFEDDTALREFLRNHVIKSVPGFVGMDESVEGKTFAVEEILIAINQEVIEALIEVKTAVAEGNKEQEMQYWADIWVQLERAIERDAFTRPDIFEHLIAARKNIVKSREGT